MLNYKDIIIRHFALHQSGREIARELGVSKTGVNDFLRSFKQCEELQYPLPEGITNYGIAILVYGRAPDSSSRDSSYELPRYEKVNEMLKKRNNMTLVFCWNRYVNRCKAEDRKFYSYRQFCENYSKWCDENYETAHFNAVIGQTMEIDFAGQTFLMTDRITGEVLTIVVFVAVLPYSQYIYAEGMISTKEPQWIEVNNRAIKAFGGVPPLVVCDNCKQAVIANKDWIQPELNQDYAEWAEHNRTVILPAKVKKPKFKSSVENAVGILESGLFHDLEEQQYFSLEQFNDDLWDKVNKLNKAAFKAKPHNRYYYWQEEISELQPLPSVEYHFMERRDAKVSSDYHIRFDNAYYSVDKAYLHKKVSIRADDKMVKIYALDGDLICEHPRATYRGQWLTDPSHMPQHYKEYASWNGPYFIRKAMTVGPCTVKVIEQILKSRKLEVQTYRLCIGVLNFSRRYSKTTLEECCRRALDLDRINYTFIKNSIPSVAEELGDEAKHRRENELRNQGAYVMSSKASDVETLLSRSQSLAKRDETEAE